MNILSLFDGMSCGQIALERAGVKVNKYYASEIKKQAIQVTQQNYPSTVQLGDINNYMEWDLEPIDLLIGGSPCQDLSFLKTDGEGLYGSKSRLFFKYLGCFNRFKPKYFLLENVRMKQEYQDTISELLGVKPIRINSNLVSFQNRDRLYWTNIPNIIQPEDKGINFQDYKETDYEICKEYKVNCTPSRVQMWEKGCPNVTYRDKINCLTCKQDRWHNAGLIAFEDFCRYLTVKECELAQNVPIGYTNGLSRSQAYDVLGDGWTVDVIAHILKEVGQS
jgi:site-specific DNA-cytosine methylase